MTHYDVIVVGGGAAGVAAAVGAAQTGARTLLVERGPCLGGAATLRNVLTYCGLYTQEAEPRQVVFGVAEQVLTRLRNHNAISPPTRFTAVASVFDPEFVKIALDEICEDAGVEVLLHSLVVQASRVDGVVQHLSLADHQGLREVTGAVFIDASGEADLAHFAGAAVRYGNDGYVQNGTLGIRIGGIEPDAVVTREQAKEAIKQARADGNTLPADGGLVTRIPVSGDVVAYLADEAYDARDARELSRAEREARKLAQAYLQAFRRIPGCGGAYLVSTGPEIGTRESRHVIAEYKMTAGDVLEGKRRDDVIARGAWPSEYHPGVGEKVEWKFIRDGDSYDIPLAALRSKDTSNLFAAGRNIDGDRSAGASLRVMGTSFATGHAAGVAAALQANGGSEVSPLAVQQQLNQQNAQI